MSQHFSEADLLETYYTQPGESLPVMMHLADCSDCAARYERLENKVRALSACDTGTAEKPDLFWLRQRHTIMTRIRSRRATQPLVRFAAAAALALVVGGSVSWPMLEKHAVQQTAPAAKVESTVELNVPTDPWDSAPLQDYQPLVEWESWVDKGGQS
jgi:anti-sigma factor RsiW